jgi:hypothetical protein
MNGIKIKQQSFRKCMDPFVWNYVVDNGLEQGNEMEDSSSEDDESVVVVSSPSKVSPPSSSVAGASITPVKSATPVDNNISTTYPHLSQALGDDNGYFDPVDPSVQTSLQGLMQEINHLLSSKYELNVRALSSNKPISYVRVPRTKSDNAFTNSKEWLDTAIIISAGSSHGGTFESAYRITNHLIKFYKDSFLAACKTQGIPVIKPMTATQFQAMLHAGKITGTGERELKKHLSSHLGKRFCPTRRSVNMLSEGHGVVHYGCCDFTYDKKEKSEFVEWTEKNIDEEITIFLQRHLSSMSVMPADVVRVDVVAGGDHGDTAFQFGASVSVELANGRTIDFEVSTCELICRKDTGRLLEETILQRLTSGLEIISTFQLHLFINDESSVIVVEYRQHGPTPNAIPSHTPITKVFVTGDLAFQAMALGKESMAGHWCMQCKASRHQFSDDCELWTMDELVRCGKDAETRQGDPLLGVKKKPWWPFIPLGNYMVPLLHCLIGIGNQLLEKLRTIIHEYIASYSPGEEAIRDSIPALQNIIADTAKERDEWDESAEGGKRKGRLMRAVAAYSRRREIGLANNNEEEELTHRANESTLKELDVDRKRLVDKLKRARRTLADQHDKLKVMQTAKGEKGSQH